MNIGTEKKMIEIQQIYFVVFQNININIGDLIKVIPSLAVSLVTLKNSGMSLVREKQIRDLKDKIHKEEMELKK